MRTWLTALALMVAAPVAATQAQSAWEITEYIFGATNLNAVTGNGRLTVGVAETGDLAVVSWPTPSYADQLGYLTSNAVDSHEQLRLGAPEGAGVFLGLILELTGRPAVVTWFRDAGWTTQQDYGPDDMSNVHTVHTSSGFGLRVRVVDAVSPSVDGLVRSITVTRDAGSAVVSAALLTYANLSPTPPDSRIDGLPVIDWAYDGRNDFAAIWDADRAAVVHFHPGDRRIFESLTDLVAPSDVDWGPIGESLVAATPDPETIASLLAELDSDYGAGTYVVLGTFPAATQHQIGYDATDFCGLVDTLADNILALPSLFPDFELPFSEGTLGALRCPRSAVPIAVAQGWVHHAEDAWSDATDGTLSGSDLAAGEVNEALRTELTFVGDEAQAHVVLALGSTQADAAEGFDAVAQDPDMVATEAETDLTDWLRDIALPSGVSEDVLAVARRALINMRVGTCSTGAIVASIARQPPYGLDWPRDGAFFNIALHASGQHELARVRAELYDSWQRKQDVVPELLLNPSPPPQPNGSASGVYPAAAWEMNYYADGRVGGVWRFEIDNTGFALWTLAAEVGWLAEADRVDYATEHWEAIASAADLLVRWRDASNGLHWPAQEDDNAAYRQTLHGAITTYGALEMASRAAREIGRVDSAQAWEGRAAELREAIMRAFYRADEGVFDADTAMTYNPGSTNTGPTAWLVWPMTLLAWDDARVRAQIEHDLDVIEPAIALETAGHAYVSKVLVSAALVSTVHPDLRPRVISLLEQLAAQATAGTHHFGEVMVTVDDDGAARASQRVAPPHLWEGALFYLTALALSDPERILAYDGQLPPSRVPDPRPEVNGQPGGGCSAVPSTGSPFALLLGTMELVRRASRRARRAGRPGSLVTP